MGDRTRHQSEFAASDGRIVHKTPAPLLWPVVAFAFGIAVAESLGGDVWWNLLLLIPIVVFVAMPFVPVRMITVLVLVAAFFVGYSRHHAAVHLPTNHIARYLHDEPILTRLTGRIVTSPILAPAEKRNPFLPFEPSPRTRFVLAARELQTTSPPTPICGFVRVSVKTETLAAQLGDLVSVTGWLYRPRGPRNPGEMDWARFNRLQNIHAALATDGSVYVQRMEGGAGLRGAIGRLRSWAQRLLFEPYAHVEADDAVGLLDAMVLGQRSGVNRHINQAFLRTGTSHFLAVSGFHVGVLIGTVWILVRWILRRSAKFAAMSTIAVILLYALIAEQNAPILRAATMGVLGCLAVARSRPMLLLNWLALSAVCLLAYNPLQLFRPGFQLSFILVLTLVTVFPRVYRWVNSPRANGMPRTDAETWAALLGRWACRWFVGLALANLCLWVFSVPLKLHHFGYIGLWSPLQSIIILPAVVATVVLGFATVGASAVLPPLGTALGVLLRGSTEFLLWIVDGLSRMPGTFIQTKQLPAWIVILTYSLALLILCRRTAPGDAGENGPSSKRRTACAVLVSGYAVVVAIAWIAWIIRPPPNAPRDFELHVLSVGNGSALIVSTPERHAFLVDLGTLNNWDVGETVAQAARALGVRRIDGVAISHANFDHYSGVPAFLESYSADSLIVSPYFPRERERHPSVRLWYQLLPADAPPINVTQAGRRLELSPALRDEGLSIEVLWPPDELSGWQPNDRSLVLRLTIAGRTILLPGDIERAAMSALLESVTEGGLSLRSDVLIAPHHGSIAGRITEEFYAAVDPGHVIVSSGRDRTKLTALVRRALGPSCRVINTREAGAVVVRIAPDGTLTVDTPYATKRPIRP